MYLKLGTISDIMDSSEKKNRRDFYNSDGNINRFGVL